MTWDRERVQWAFTRLAVSGLVAASAWWTLDHYVLRPHVDIAPLGPVDRVDVFVGSGKRVVVTDRATVAALVTFAEDVREGWHDTWHTVPATPVRVCYFGRFRGGIMRYQCIGAARGILTIVGDELWAVQDADEAQTRRLMALTGVAETLLDRR